MIFTTLRLYCKNTQQMEYCLNHLANGPRISHSLFNNNKLINIRFSDICKHDFKTIESEMLDYINDNENILSIIREEGNGMMLFIDIFHYDEDQSGIFLSTEFIGIMAKYGISLDIATYR